MDPEEIALVERLEALDDYQLTTRAMDFIEDMVADMEDGSLELTDAQREWAEKLLEQYER